MSEKKEECAACQNKACSTLLLILKFIVIQLHCIFDYLVDFCFGLYYDQKAQKVPPVEDKLLLCSATELAEKIRSKEVSVVHVVQTFINRAKEVNVLINAITEERFNEALDEARAADEFILMNGTGSLLPDKPFFGVPFTTKDSHLVTGMLHTMGLLNRRHHRGTEDAPVVGRMKAAGGILLAKTNVPELNLWQESRNNLYGQTCNPYNSTRTVGGSSGGEAALVASCGSAISVAADIGGSTRMPAFYNGLFGHKPTAGVLPIRGIGLRTEENPESMVAPGPICKMAADLTPAMKVLAGEKIPVLRLDRAVDVTKLRVYYQESSGDMRASLVSGAQLDALRRAVGHLRTVTGSANKIRAPGTEYSYRLWRYWMTREKADFSRDLSNNRYRAGAFAELIRLVTGRSEFTGAAVMKLWDEQYLPKEDSDWAEGVTRRLTDYLNDKLKQDGVLLFPSCPTTAPYHYVPYLKPFNFSYWCLFNALKFPVSQVPMGLDENGLPVGVQVVAAPYNDNLCIAVAMELEKAFGGWVQPS